MKTVLFRLLIFVMPSIFLLSCSKTVKKDEGIKYYETSFFGKKGIKDFFSGRTLVPCRYDSVVLWCQNSGKKFGMSPMYWFMAYKDGTVDLYNEDGSCLLYKGYYADVCPLLFRTPSSFSLWYRVEDEIGRVGFCDTSGHEVVPCRFKKVNVVTLYKYHFETVNSHGRTLYLLDREKDEKGGIIIEKEYIRAFDGKYMSLYNTEGEVVIPSSREYKEIGYLEYVSKYYWVGELYSGRKEVLDADGELLFSDNADRINLEFTETRIPYFVAHMYYTDDDEEPNQRFYDKSGRFLFEHCHNYDNSEVAYDNQKGFYYERRITDEFGDPDWETVYLNRKIK